MSDKDSKPLNILAEGAVKGAGQFLGKICNPAAEEFGLLLRDKVRHWRNKNFIKIAKEAEELTERTSEDRNLQLSPRILSLIYENGSWVEDRLLQKMWAGLMASSCYDDGSDKSIIYVDILSKISKAEAELLNYISRSCEWRITVLENIVEALPVFPTPLELKKVTELESFEDIIEVVSHLEVLGLIVHEKELADSRIEHYDETEKESLDWEKLSEDGQWADYVELKLTNLGIRLFLRAQGIEKRPSEYISEKFPTKWGSFGYQYDSRDKEI